MHAKDNKHGHKPETRGYNCINKKDGNIGKQHALNKTTNNKSPTAFRRHKHQQHAINKQTKKVYDVEGKVGCKGFSQNPIHCKWVLEKPAQKRTKNFKNKRNWTCETQNGQHLKRVVLKQVSRKKGTMTNCEPARCTRSESGPTDGITIIEVRFENEEKSACAQTATAPVHESAASIQPPSQTNKTIHNVMVHSGNYHQQTPKEQSDCCTKRGGAGEWASAGDIRGNTRRLVFTCAA